MNCETCGKILKGKQTKFCSKSCKNKANRKNHMKTQEGLGTETKNLTIL